MERGRGRDFRLLGFASSHPERLQVRRGNVRVPVAPDAPPPSATPTRRASIKAGGHVVQARFTSFFVMIR